jgi:hypothetical protein
MSFDRMIIYEKVGYSMRFNRWIHRMIWLKEDIHCDLFVKMDTLDDLISVGY